MPRLIRLAVLVMLLAGCAASPAAAPASSSPADPPASPSPAATAANRAVGATPSSMLSPAESPTPPPPAQTAPATRNAITVLYDNVASDSRLQTDWGFAALIEYRGETLLFDTGNNGKILLANMRTLGVDPNRIGGVVLSHAHSDHTLGLPALLNVSSKPPVYLLTAFGPAHISGVEAKTTTVETTPGMEIASGIFTTGKVNGSVAEQALAIRTSRGLIVITGCAHPGVDRMVKAAMDLSGEPAYMVIGGFHLADSSRSDIAATAASLHKLGVQRVAPSHCTGAAAAKIFADEFGDGYVQSGVGKVIVFDA